MKIGRLDIRWIRPETLFARPANVAADFTGALAVPVTETWWQAVHQIIDQAELECVAGARTRKGDANLCIAAVGAGEGCDLVRRKLIDAREIALTYVSEWQPRRGGE